MKVRTTWKEDWGEKTDWRWNWGMEQRLKDTRWIKMLLQKVLCNYPYDFRKICIYNYLKFVIEILRNFVYIKNDVFIDLYLDCIPQRNLCRITLLRYYCFVVFKHFWNAIFVISLGLNIVICLQQSWNVVFTCFLIILGKNTKSHGDSPTSGEYCNITTSFHPIDLVSIFSKRLCI